MAVRVASLGGVGRLRPAPGTWGSAVVLPAALLGPWGALGVAAVATAAACWAVPRAVRGSDRGDPGWIVIDEAAGQALALAALPAGAGWLGVALAFVLFRAFDVLKPGPVGWADRRPGAAWVIADDLIAGALAGCVLLGLRVAGVAL